MQQAHLFMYFANALNEGKYQKRVIHRKGQDAYLTNDKNQRVKV